MQPVAGERAERFITVPKGHLRSESPPNFDIYVRASNRFVLYHRAGAALDADAERRAGQSIPEVFYVHPDDAASLRAYRLDDLQRALSSDDTPMRRAQLLLDTGGGTMRSLLADPDDGVLLETASDIAVLAMEQVIAEPKLLSSLLALGRTGEHRYAHAVQCCILASALGYRVGLDVSELSSLVVAGLLHDVGQARLDPQLISRDPLTFNNVEWTMFKRHPILGAEALTRAHLPREVATFVRQHHERTDGSGYPGGIAGDAISTGGRIVAIIDVYEQYVTSPGPEALTPFHALSRMRYRKEAASTSIY